jgi:heme exporter protein D
MAFDFDAGKYAFYVWTSFGVTAVVVAWMIADSLARAGKWKREAERLQAQKDAKKVKA